MYDGFVIGNRQDIYNPWSICCYMKKRELLPYWVNTTSNSIIADLIRKNSMQLKQEMEILLQGGSIRKMIYEEIAYQYLDGDEDTFWALLISIGYVKPISIRKKSEGTECELIITNQESRIMFQVQILRMFRISQGKYGQFVESLLHHDLEMLRYHLEDIMYSSVSYYDTGRLPSRRILENFYHGLVLGLIVALQEHCRGQRQHTTNAPPIYLDMDTYCTPKLHNHHTSQIVPQKIQIFTKKYTPSIVSSH